MICTTIIPTINRPTLERTVRSALAQGLDSGQHEILVFNNSGGKLPDTEWLSDPRVRVIESHSDAIDASNKGAAMALGTYINFLHDDDYLLPNALTSLLSVAKSSGCGWVYGAYRLIDDEENFLRVVPANTRGNMLAWLLSGECIHFACSLIKRDAFLRTGGLDRAIAVWLDLDLLCRIALYSDFECTNEIDADVTRSGGARATFEYAGIAQDYRKLREKTLDSPVAFGRIRDSMGQGVVLRGRACRAYLVSCILNLLSVRFVVAWSRFISFLRLAGCSLCRLRFWHVLLRWPRVGLEW